MFYYACSVQNNYFVFFFSFFLSFLSVLDISFEFENNEDAFIEKIRQIRKNNYLTEMSICEPHPLIYNTVQDNLLAIVVSMKKSPI